MKKKEPDLFNSNQISYKKGKNKLDKIHLTETGFIQNQEFIDSVFANHYETKVGDYRESVFNNQLKILMSMSKNKSKFGKVAEWFKALVC